MSDYDRINQYIKEFLRFNKYQSTVECFEAEERTKLVTAKNSSKQMNIQPDDARSLDTFPRLYRFFEADQGLGDREKRFEQQIKALESKVAHTMIASR